jgi:hypothetical protein
MWGFPSLHLAWWFPLSFLVNTFSILFWHMSNYRITAMRLRYIRFDDAHCLQVVVNFQCSNGFVDLPACEFRFRNIIFGRLSISLHRRPPRDSQSRTRTFRETYVMSV